MLRLAIEITNINLIYKSIFINTFCYFCIMQYQQLVKRTYQILKNPRATWQTIVETEKNSDKVMNEFVLPLSGLCALTAFLGILFQGLGLEKALLGAIISIVKSLGGVYLSFFIIQETARFVNLERDKTHYMQLVGYSYAIIFILDIITNLIPDLFFMSFFKLYIIYMVWEAVEFCTKITDNKRVGYTIGIAALLLISSLAIGTILTAKLMPVSEIIAG